MEPINYHSYTYPKMYSPGIYTSYDEVVPFFLSDEWTFDVNGEVVFRGVCLGKGTLAISNFAKEKNMDIENAVLLLYNTKLKELRDDKLEFILS